MVNSSRRQFVRDVSVYGSLVALAKGGFLGVAYARPDAWNEASFEALDLASAISGITGEPVENDGDQLIRFVAPPIAENGAVVPVGVKVESEKTIDSIAILCDKNPRPLAAYYQLHPDAIPFIRTRIKMRETSSVVAIVHTPDGYVRSEHLIKVTKGGCG